MSTTIAIPSAEETERAINAATDKIIASTCAKHGLTPSQLSSEAINDAKRTAVHMVARDQARAANPMYGELEAERQKNHLLEMQLAAIKQGRVNVANDKQPPVTVAVARARLGEKAWCIDLTDAGRLQAIGIDPSTVNAGTKQEILDLFGPKSDSARSNDAFKSNPGRYRQLRGVGRAMRWI